MKKEARKRTNLRTKHRKLSGKELSNYVEQLFEERGRDPFETAKKLVLEEADKIESKTIRDALHYLTGYWTDTTRPALLSIACEAAGGNPEATATVAVPLILICGAVDVHDDIIDKSIAKRKHVTLYGKFGAEIATLVGDALLFKGLAMLSEAKQGISNKKREEILRTTKELFFELGDAEALELSFRGRTDLKAEDYLAMVTKKAADAEAYLRISAIIADASEEETDALAGYGRVLGKLIILGDDNSDMLNPSEIVNRIRNEALPLSLLYALENPEPRRLLMRILAKKKITMNDARHILNLTYEAGAFDRMGTLMRNLIKEGKSRMQAMKNPELLEAILDSAYPE
jgi:geranylgeranyl diphosphate synthase type I